MATSSQCFQGHIYVDVGRRAVIDNVDNINEFLHGVMGLRYSEPLGKSGGGFSVYIEDSRDFAYTSALPGSNMYTGDMAATH
jgi:hypothetical protein